MKINKWFWTSKAKEKLRKIKKKWRSFGMGRLTMPYREFRNEIIMHMGSSKPEDLRQQLIQIISDKQLRDAKRFYNSRRNN